MSVAGSLSLARRPVVARLFPDIRRWPPHQFSPLSVTIEYRDLVRHVSEHESQSEGAVAAEHSEAQTSAAEIIESVSADLPPHDSVLVPCDCGHIWVLESLPAELPDETKVNGDRPEAIGVTKKRVRRGFSLGPARVSRPGWTQEASTRVVSLRDRMPHVKPDGVALAGDLIHDAEKLILEPKAPLRPRLSNWWNGGRVERTWAYLHEAEQLIVEYSDERGLELALEDAIARAEYLDEKDPLRVRLEAYVAHLAKAPEVKDEHDD